MDPGTRRWYQTRFGLSRENIRSNEIGVGNTAQQFGIPNVKVDELPKGLPLISFPGLDIIGAKDNIPAIIVSQNTQFGDNLDAVPGNHSLKVGFGVIFRQTNAYQSSFSRSQFVSTTIYTSNPAVTGISGNGAADLLGLRTMANFFVGRPIGGATTAPSHQHWSFGVQRQLPHDSVVEVNYAGSAASICTRATRSTIRFRARLDSGSQTVPHLRRHHL